MIRGFDPLVPFYDLLASVVFLGAINRSHKALTASIKPDSNVLILGGGTGKLLEYLDESISVTYVELSKQMIVKAQKRNIKARVDFVQCDFMQWESEKEFDYILCPFFLDLFPENELHKVIQKIKTLLKQEGDLLVADFNGESKSLFHQILLKLMFWFFYFSGAIKIKVYNYLFRKIEEESLSFKVEEVFYGSFIRFSRNRFKGPA